MQADDSRDEQKRQERAGQIGEIVDIDDGGNDDAPMDEDDGDDEAMSEGEEEHFKDTSIAAFYEHRDSIFTLRLHPNFPAVPIAFTGGADDRGRLWDTRTGEQLAELAGHTDSVVTGGFSADGKLVATGSLDGTVRVYKLQLAAPGTFAPAEPAAPTNGDNVPSPTQTRQDWGRCEHVATLDGPDELVWLQWHPRGNVLAAGASDATVWMWNLPQGNLMFVFSGHTGAVTCGDFTADGKKLVTASEDGSLIVWDPKNGTALSKLQPSDARFNFDAGITAMALSADNKIAVVGGTAGTLRVVNLANIDDGGAALVVSALDGHADGESIETIHFVDLLGKPNGSAAQPTPRVKTSINVITASTDGKAVVWDLSSSKVRCEAVQDEAITSLAVHGAGPLFSTSCADGKVVTWDARSATCIAVHQGFDDAVLNVVVGPDDGYTQGAETGGVGAHADPANSRGWKVIGAGDEGVALVFRV